MRISAISVSAAALAGLAFSSPSSAATYGPCGFDSQTLRFAGSVVATTACLLRKVREKGGGADAQPVPAWLLDRVTKPVPIGADQLRRYLEAQGISTAELTDRIAFGDTPGRRYFVIHDTSSPEIAGSGPFPSDIDQPGKWGNNLAGWAGVARKVNLIVGRDGRSRPLVPWGENVREAATKIETGSRVPLAKPLFVHVENVQPRLKPPGTWAWKAPVPGLSPAQERRLALAYIVASVRSGKWLIPAYHFNIDQGLPDAHDDPQHMDLESWVSRLREIEAAITAP